MAGTSAARLADLKIAVIPALRVLRSGRTFASTGVSSSENSLGATRRGSNFTADAGRRWLTLSLVVAVSIN